MLRFIYQWRYQRTQRSSSFQVPSDRDGYSNGQVNLGSYMSQASVRGRSFNRFDLPKKRRRSFILIATILAAILLGWIVVESALALELLKN